MGRDRIFSPSPLCCVTARLYRLNVTRRLSKTLVSCQISLRCIFHRTVNFAKYAAKKPSPVAITQLLGRLYVIR